MDSKKGRNGLQEEFTAALLSELTISPEDEIMLKAGCVWDNLVWDASEEEISHRAKIYGITYEDCIRHKEHWAELKFIISSEEFHKRLGEGQTIFIYDRFEEIVVKFFFDKEENRVRTWIKRKGFAFPEEVSPSSKRIFEAQMGGFEVREKFYMNY